MRDVQRDRVLRSPCAVAEQEREPDAAAKPNRNMTIPRAAKFVILTLLSLGLWWGIWAALRSMWALLSRFPL